MIISVGGTPEPVVKSLLENKPEYVCFFASQQSIDNIGEIKNCLKSEGYYIKDYKVMCDDADDLVHCYEKALECSLKLEAEGIEADKVVVDYTAGTKTMTAALALATVGHGYNFSYVSGKERTKNGLGIVVSGTEVVKEGISPWQIFAVEEKKRISLFISTFQYEAAISILRQTMKNLRSRDKEIWSGIAKTLEGFQAWDNFDHKNAMTFLSSGIKQLDMCKKFGLNKPIGDFLAKVKDNFLELDNIGKKTKFFNKMDLLLVRDLVSNAYRRYLQNKYDDAVARLYRSIEMVGQISFEKAFGCSTSDVSPEKLPEKIREELIQRYIFLDEEKINLPLYATFRVLKEINHPAGLIFFENEESIKKIIFARNASILAHGTQHIEKETCEKFTKIIRGLFVEGPPVEFPVTSQ